MEAADKAIPKTGQINREKGGIIYTISTIEQARTVLAIENLSSEEVRELLLYFLQRDEETKRAADVMAGVLTGMLKTLPSLTAPILRFIPRNDLETIQHLENLMKEARQLLESLQPKIPKARDEAAALTGFRNAC